MVARYQRLMMCLVVLLLNEPRAPTYAAAPERTAAWCTSIGQSCPGGIPYAEPALCASTDVIFCEDFNTAAHFYCKPGVADNQDHAWWNPARVNGLGSTPGANGPLDDYIYACAARSIPLATDYPAKPQGAMPSGATTDRAWMTNWDPAKGVQGAGNTVVLIHDPSVNGDNYANGTAPSPDVYVRLQVYWTPDYTWPGDPRPDVYCYGAAGQTDNKILFVYNNAFAWNGTQQNPGPTSASYDAGLYTVASVYDPLGPGACGNGGARFADAMAFRVGNAAEFAFFPLCPTCVNTNHHTEYAPFQSYTLRNPNDTPRTNKVFRFDTGKWYTIEYRYKLSTPDVGDGTIEAWIDGTKVYSANDLPTCGSGNGGCNGIGLLYLSAYHNDGDQTIWDGQQVIDNVVVSRSYIGVPDGAASAISGRFSGGVRMPGPLRFR